MAFCGQCGYQLRASDAACPHCGMVTEPMLTAGDTIGADDTGATHADSPTIAIPGRSPTRQTYETYNQTSMPTSPNTPPPPYQPIIIHAVDNTTVTDPSSYPGAYGQYPGYPPQSSSYPGYPPSTSPSAPPEATPERRGRGPIYLFILVVLLLLAAAGAFTWYLAYGHTYTTHQTPSPTVAPSPMLTPSLTVMPSPTLTPSQQARAVIVQYYNDINNHDYQDAYNLLGSALQHNQSYSNFVSGYAHTRHDVITFGNVSPQSNGDYVVALTLQATEDANSGTGIQISTFQGSDTVGPENGVWKILSGNLQKQSTVPG